MMALNNIERTTHFKTGPRFYRDEEKGLDMFEHRIDSRACIGPRVATKIDKQNHSDLWAEYLEARTGEMDRNLKKRK